MSRLEVPKWQRVRVERFEACWTKEEDELYTWRHRHKIGICSLTYSDRTDFYVTYAVDAKWPSWSARLLVIPV